MPDPQKLLTTLRQAARLFRATPGRTGRFTRLPAGAEVMVVGDLHGNLENFRLALKVADLARHQQRHFVLQEVIHGAFQYANGGGDKSHQLLDLLAALKCQYPARVHFLLGNHELAQWQNQRIGKGDVDQNQWFLAGVEIAYGAHAGAVYEAYLELFNAADLALRTENRVFLSHTLPSAKNLPHFELAILEEAEISEKEKKLGGAVHSLVWNRDLSQANVEAFLKKVDADWLITGHIPCEQGFMVPNDRQIILDALGTPACYCLFPTHRPLTQQELLNAIGTV
jgi:calcineurin-like phosphoesterase family protein